VDPAWLLILAAIGLFLGRAALIARRLKQAASSPTLPDARALREARQGLKAHRESLDEAVAGTKGHLAEARRLASRTSGRGRAPASRVSAMVEDFTPDRRF